jgi:hypothetical protein
LVSELTLKLIIMKKKSLKSLRVNKQVISSVNSISVVGGGKSLGPLYTFIIECLTEECPTESQQSICYTLNPLNCIAPPND